MIVVADTSPLNYLVLIDEIDLLPAIFGRVLLPHAEGGPFKPSFGLSGVKNSK